MNGGKIVNFGLIVVAVILGYVSGKALTLGINAAFGTHIPVSPYSNLTV